MKPRLNIGTPMGIICLGVWLLPGHAIFAADSAAGKPGYLFDSYRLLPQIEVTGYYDDNIYATKRARESDQVVVISPSLSIDSLWDRHSLALEAGAMVGRYLDNSAEDYEDFWVKGDGQIDLTESSRIYAGAGYSVNHESRDSKESAAQQIDEPTTYDASSLQIGVDQRVGQAGLIKFGGTYEALNYDNIGTLYNDDRDRRVTGLGLRYSRPIADQTLLYAQGILNQRSYDDEHDQFGYKRDSDGYNAYIGLSRESEAGHRIEAYVGYLEQDYDDNRFDHLREPNYGFDVLWYPAAETKVSGKLERSLNETTEVGSSGYLYTGFDLQLDQKLYTDVMGYLNYNNGLAEFQDVGREDSTQTFTLGLKYYMSPKVMLSGSFSHIDNDSNDRNRVSPISGTYDYTRNLFFITLRARLTP
jgi:hypothetical protein